MEEFGLFSAMKFPLHLRIRRSKSRWKKNGISSKSLWAMNGLKQRNWRSFQVSQTTFCFIQKLEQHDNITHLQMLFYRIVILVFSLISLDNRRFELERDLQLTRQQLQQETSGSTSAHESLEVLQTKFREAQRKVDTLEETNNRLKASRIITLRWIKIDVL